MSFRISGKLEGIEEILDALSGLKAGKARTIIRNALEPAGTVVKKAVISGQTRRETGTLKRSIAAATRTYPAKNLVMVFIGPKLGSGADVQIAQDRVFRQVGAGGRFGKSGKTRRIWRPRADQLRMYRNPVKYAHLIEFGTKHQSPSKRRTAYHTLRNAFEASKAAAAAKFIEKATAGLENYFLRLR